MNADMLYTAQTVSLGTLSLRLLGADGVSSPTSNSRVLARTHLVLVFSCTFLTKSKAGQTR